MERKEAIRICRKEGMIHKIKNGKVYGKQFTLKDGKELSEWILIDQYTESNRQR